MMQGSMSEDSASTFISVAAFQQDASIRACGRDGALGAPNWMKADCYYASEYLMLASINKTNLPRQKNAMLMRMVNNYQH